jgi:hypothetical protein
LVNPLSRRGMRRPLAYFKSIADPTAGVVRIGGTLSPVTRGRMLDQDDVLVIQDGLQ